MAEEVAVTLTNHHAFLTIKNSDTHAALADYWSFYPEGYRFMPSYKMGAWDGRIRLFKNSQLAAGLFRATRRELEATGVAKFTITYAMPEVAAFRQGILVSDPKYSYQLNCVDVMCQTLCRGGGIVLAATGTGKTVIAAQFFSRLSYSCLFVVDQLDLLYQSQDALAKWLKEPVGIVGDERYSPERVTAATIQTLHKHLADSRFQAWYRSVKVVVVDELHEQMARRNFVVLERIKPLARYGLTATLQLGKKSVRYKAHAFAGPVIYSFPIAKATEEKVVTTGQVLQLLFPLAPMTGTTAQMELEDQVLTNEMKHRACRLIVDELIRRGRYVIVLVDRIKHLEALDAICANVRRSLAYGKIEVSDRTLAKQRFENEEIQLILANKVFRKGVDIKRVDAIVDLAEMKSKNDCVQKYGRGIRLHKDKDALLYVDFGTAKGRYKTAASSRFNAFRKQQIPVQRVAVDSIENAVQQVKKVLDG